MCQVSISYMYSSYVKLQSFSSSFAQDLENISSSFAWDLKSISSSFSWDLGNISSSFFWDLSTCFYVFINCETPKLLVLLLEISWLLYNICINYWLLGCISSFRFKGLKFFDSFAQNLLTFLCSSSGSFEVLVSYLIPLVLLYLMKPFLTMEL
jgi:hypothetical protein